MANANKFWKAVVWGALAGGAVSLLDRQTRLAMKENCCNAAGSVANFAKNPGKVVKQVKQSALKFKAAVNEIGEDLSFIASKVEELRETTPAVVKMVKETKDTFTKDDSDSEEIKLE